MRRLFIVLLVVAAVPMFAQQNAPQIPFDSVPDYFKSSADMNNWRVQKLLLHPGQRATAPAAT